MKRNFDPNTMTYAYSDGSGRITHEKVIERKLLLEKIKEMEAEDAPSILIAAAKFKYLTFNQ